MRHLNNCVVRGPYVRDCSKAVKTLLSHGTERFKYSELELITN